MFSYVEVVLSILEIKMSDHQIIIVESYCLQFSLLKFHARVFECQFIVLY